MIPRSSVLRLRRSLRKTTAKQSREISAIIAASDLSNDEDVEALRKVLPTIYQQHAYEVAYQSKGMLSKHTAQRLPETGTAVKRGRANAITNTYLKAATEAANPKSTVYKGMTSSEAAAARKALLDKAQENYVREMASLTFNTQRDYTAEVAARNSTSYVIEASPDACPFCRMTALNEYHYKDSSGISFHKGCECMAVPASDYEQPAYVSEWREQYEGARLKAKEEYGGVSSTDITSAWRASLSSGAEE